MSKFDLYQLVRKNILGLKPYSSARDEYTGKEGVFLDANENPFGEHNRYPDPHQKELKKSISQLNSVSENNIFIGNGSDEIIDLTYRIFCNPGKDKAIILSPTYGMYEVSAEINDIEIIQVPLNDKFQIDSDLLEKYFSDENIKLLFICSPNNPTGNNIENIESIIGKFKGIIFVDEAYNDFSDAPSLINKIDQYPNLIVSQTFSKAWALAAVRIGVAYSNSKIISLFNKVKPPYNVSTLNQNAVVESLLNYSEFVKKAHKQKITVIAACDILALSLLTPPGELGVDVAIGSTQRFGVPMGFGGPHAAYLATKDELKRSMPGRIIGVSIDANNNPAMRLALQTREQHIRREKATSNICTAQVLLAVIAGMYAVYHGPKGITKIAKRTHRITASFAQGMKSLGYKLKNQYFFDTLSFETDLTTAQKIKSLSNQYQLNLRWNFGIASNDKIFFGLSFDETSTPEKTETLWKLFAEAKGQNQRLVFADIEPTALDQLPKDLIRSSNFLTHPIFNTHHSETEMLRYIFKLQGKDLSLAHSMIPLGSCTMKLNATAEMIPVTWPEFSNLHPLAPREQSLGYQGLIGELESMLIEITGFAGISLQPNAGSQGEYAGLLAIRKFHQGRGDGHRNICLIPSSAHGTNPASAVMAGMQVVITACDSEGNVDIKDLSAKALLHAKNLAALMITYPSTHGVFEEGIKDICDIIHGHGGQVYMDGANFNALVGLCKPGEFGPDVCHLNLHKTFCIPHGGGGPGVGPVGVREHLVPYLPTTTRTYGANATQRVSSAPFGSSSILCISWAYIKMMGGEGLKKATQVAILNANYMAEKLSKHYPILYRGKNGYVAHECILDLRPLKAFGVEAEDVAKRLMDYGFHAPTMSWPVTGTLMLEPTESESKPELDRYCEAMIQIREEIRLIETGKIDKLNNPLKRAPHTQSVVTATEWDRPYSRETACFPAPWLKDNKFWPAVARVNNPHGDRNLVCSCLPVENFQQ